MCGGCGGNKLPATVQLRQFAVSLAQGDVERAREVYEFVVGDDANALNDTPTFSPADTASRNVLINTPLSRVFGLKNHGLSNITLGAFVQFPTGGEADQAVLDQYGLRFGMANDDLREWVLHGPGHAA